MKILQISTMIWLSITLHMQMDSSWPISDTVQFLQLGEQRQEAKCGDNYPPFVTKDTAGRTGRAVSKNMPPCLTFLPKQKEFY